MNVECRIMHWLLLILSFLLNSFNLNPVIDNCEFAQMIGILLFFLVSHFENVTDDDSTVDAFLSVYNSEIYPDEMFKIVKQEFLKQRLTSLRLVMTSQQ